MVSSFVSPPLFLSPTESIVMSNPTGASSTPPGSTAASNRKAYSREYARKLRARRKEDPTLHAAYNKFQRDRHRSAKQRAVEYLGNACADCGGTFHQSVYDFHHKDVTAKEFAPSYALLLKWDKVKAELDKCVMLCANCHRLRHYAQETPIN